MRDREYGQVTGDILVATAVAVRGMSLLFSKIAMQSIGPMQLMGMRFMIAFVALALLFHKSLAKVTRRELWHCALLGLFYMLAMGFELQGLKTIDSSITAFLEGFVVVTVPAVTCIIRRKLPDKATVVSSLVAIIGVGILTLKGTGFGFNIGEVLCLIGTVWYSFTVIVTDVAAKEDDPIVISVFQSLFISIFTWIGAFIFEEPAMPATGAEWGAILALALLCGCVGFTLQVFGQRFTTPERSGLMSVFSPFTAAILGVLVLSEPVTWTLIVGGILITVATVAPTLMKKI